MRKLDSHLNAFNAVSKQMSMLILEFNWHFQCGPKWEAQCFIEVMLMGRRQGVDVRDQHVQHHNLTTPALILGDMDCHLAVLIKCTNGLVVHQLNYRSLCFPIFISLTRIIVHTQHAVAKLQPRLLVCRNLAQSTRWQQIKMRVLIGVWDELRHSDRKLVLDLKKSASLEPVLVASVNSGVFNCHCHLQGRFSGS